MSAEIINLNAARKRKSRAAKEERAAGNRSRHGRTKAEKHRDVDEETRARKQLDDRKLEDSPPDG
ncbi:MAG: DUF4169 family protein [Alphaproteobacteria bacterium]|nr:DUF4169 family protein [Alphaproteobacteria bacterium]